MAQTTVNLQCLGDTYADDSNPNTNYSAQTSLKIKPYPDFKNSYFKFDISSLPARKRIISAYLKVYFQGFSSPGNFAKNGVLIRSYDVDINENQITYNTRPESVYDSVYHGKALTAVQQSSANSYVNLLVTSQIASAYSQNRQNLWIECRREEGDKYEQTYTSKESATNKPYLEIVYEDVHPNAPTPTDPIGTYKDSKSIIRFAWQYNSDVGGTQSAFDVQWSTDQVNWTTVSETTANSFYDMPADTVPAGNIYWRVRCYNEYNEVGPYCDIQSFYAIGAPDAPAINTIPTDTARPTVTWAAFSQQVYQLQVLSGDDVVYDSGVVPGINIRSHKITAWLADGSYTVKMRIKNEYDMWSKWSETAVTISTVKPEKPTVTAAKTIHGIKLTLSNVNGRTLIYRDGVCIGETSTGEYIDNSVANGREYSYIARAVEGYPEREIINLLGEDGDCEDTSKWLVWQSTPILDSYSKVIGSNSIKIAISAGVGTIAKYKNSLPIKSASYYMFSAYVKNGNASGGISLSTAVASTLPITDTASFHRVCIRLTPEQMATIADEGTFDIGVFGEPGQYAYVDGVMINEITEDEYNNLTIGQLLAKYPYGNNTFIAPSDETFTDSDPVTATADFKHAHIAPASDLTDIFTFTRSLNAPPKRTYNRQPGGAFVEYAGRKYPVWEPTEHVSAAWLMSFFLKSWEDVEELIDLIERKETVLYRDARGRKIYGVLGNLTVNDERSGYTVGFTLTKVDHIEEVEA